MTVTRGVSTCGSDRGGPGYRALRLLSRTEPVEAVLGLQTASEVCDLR